MGKEKYIQGEQIGYANFRFTVVIVIMQKEKKNITMSLVVL